MGIYTSVKTVVTYKVPTWDYCNHMDRKKLITPGKDNCKFCVKVRGEYSCVLYGEVLDIEEGKLLKKTERCIKASLGYNSKVNTIKDEDKPLEVDPKLLIKTTLDTYIKERNKLMAQGYPEPIADKVVRDYLLGGK